MTPTRVAVTAGRTWHMQHPGASCRLRAFVYQPGWTPTLPQHEPWDGWWVSEIRQRDDGWVQLELDGCTD